MPLRKLPRKINEEAVAHFGRIVQPQQSTVFVPCATLKCSKSRSRARQLMAYSPTGAEWDPSRESRRPH